LTLTGCSGSGFLLTIVSDKSPFKFANYRFPLIKKYEVKAANQSAPIDLLEVGQVPAKGNLEQFHHKNTFSRYKHLHTFTRTSWNSAQARKGNHFMSWKNTLESAIDLTKPDAYKIKKRQSKTPIEYEERTIELAVITDPLLFNKAQEVFFEGNGSDEDVIIKIYSLVHEMLVSAQAFLLHPTISSRGGFRLRLTGIQVLKDWTHFHKMSRRKHLISVLHDLANYLKVMHSAWAGSVLSYDGVLLLTGGKESFADGDGYSYIGHICHVDCPMVSKVMLTGSYLNKNMGRLVVHEMGHLLGADHDETLSKGEDDRCQHGEFLMSAKVNTSMHVWSPCTSAAIDANIRKHIDEDSCFFS